MKNSHYSFRSITGYALMFMLSLPLAGWSQSTSKLNTIDFQRSAQRTARAASAAKAAATTIRIKVSEDMASRLEGAKMTRTTDDVLRTGIKAIDVLNSRFDVQTLKRVYRPAGIFEAKHRAYGLHLWYEVTVKEGTSLDDALAAYASEASISIAEKFNAKLMLDYDHYEPVDFTTMGSTTSMMADLTWPSDDPLLSYQWHYNNTGSSQTNGGTAGADISLAEAWGIETGTTDVIVSIVDGGVDFDHEDLAANMWTNPGETPGNGIDDDNNGYVDDYYGYNFVDDTGTIAPEGHGTHVAGTVAAVTNNTTGVAGIAGGDGTSGSGARIMTCEVFTNTSNGGFDEAIIYGADMGAVISQNSWGYSPAGAYEQSVLDAIDYFIAEAGKDSQGNQTGPMSGGIFIVASGNDNSQSNYYPGYYAPTLAVSATNNADGHASYSNYGSYVDISAPGGDYIVAANEMVASTYVDDQYYYAAGTSMACPHVSGVAALVVSYFGATGFTAADLRTILVSTTDDIESNLSRRYRNKMGSGRLNAYAALSYDESTASTSTPENIFPEANDFTNIYMPGKEEAFEEMTLAPVPAKEELVVSLTNNTEMAGESVITIINLQGQIFYQRKLPITEIRNLRIPVRELGLKSGLYHINISGNNIQKNQLFIKE